MGNADILARIKRLLGRTEGNGCTQAEAAAAMAKARDLLQRHSLDIDQVMNFEPIEYVDGVIDERPEYSRKMPHEYQQLGIILSNHFEVEIYYETEGNPDRMRLMAFGSPLAVETASWVYRYLFGVFEDLWTRYRVETKAPKRKRRAYFEGLMTGLAVNLRHNQPEATPGDGKALAVIGNARARAFNDRVRPTLTCKKRANYRSSNDWEVGKDGYLSGKEINIARPVAEGSSRALPVPGE